MVGRVRHRFVALTAIAAVALVAIGPIGGTPAAGAAVVLNVTATPSAGLRAGDQVVLTVSNLDATSLITAGQCDASIVDAPDPFAAHLSQCNLDVLVAPADGRVTRTVVETFSPSALPAPVHCGDAPGDCVMFVSSDAGSIGFAPIDVVPSPLAVAPTTVTTRQSFHTWVSGEPGAAATVAQCAVPVADTLADGDCPVTVPVTLDGTGRGAVTLDPVLTIATAAGTADCQSGTGCALASFDAAGARLASVGVTVTKPSFLLDAFPTPAENLADGQEIAVQVQANTTEALLVGQCAASVAGAQQLAGGPCRDVREVTVPPAPAGTLGTTTITYAVARTFVGNDGSEVDCSPFSSCVMAVDTVAADDASLATRPIEFEHPPPVVTTSDTTRLLDGTPVTIDVAGVQPGATFIPGLCDQPATTLAVLFDHCSPPSPGPTFVVADAAGNLHVEVAAVQRYTTVLGTTQVYCRDQCRISLFAGEDSVEVPYTMARGA